MIRVSDVMTRNVVSISPSAKISDAIKLMLKHRISGLPVVDGKGRPVGIITEGDLLRRPEIGTERRRRRWLDSLFGPGEAAEAYVRAHGQKVKDVMTREVLTVKEATPLHEVAHLMEHRNIKRLPVVRAGKLAGIISRANLLRVLASLRRELPTREKSGAAIRNRILGDIAKQDWAYGCDVDVIVRNGVADLWGTISDMAQRDALRALVESMPGVKKVEDHLRWDAELMSVT
jgi:CBS domain-containing protein